MRLVGLALILVGCEQVDPYQQAEHRGPSPGPAPAPQPTTPAPAPSSAVEWGEIEYAAGTCPEPDEPWIRLPRSAIVQVVACSSGGCVVDDGTVWRDPVGERDDIRVPCGKPDSSYSLRWVVPN